jgi:hypothetical protein
MPGGRIAIVAMLLLGCRPRYAATATPIVGPDGTNQWSLVRCGNDMTVCYDLAHKSCHGAYEIADRDDQYSAYTSGSTTKIGNTYVGSANTYTVRHGEMLIRCKSEELLPLSAPPSPPLCAKAYEQIRDLANAWVEANPDREIREDLPARDKFIAACRVFPEEVQICLNASYLKGHHDKCQDAFDTTGERDWRVLDGLFLVPEKH